MRASHSGRRRRVRRAKRPRLERGAGTQSRASSRHLVRAFDACCARMLTCIQIQRGELCMLTRAMDASGG
eukprot:4044382-Pleurochrysis_carterae.AAC.2